MASILDKIEAAPEEVQPLVPTKKLVNPSDLFIVSIGYVIATMLSGLTMNNMGDCVDELADNLGKTGVDIGGVFISRGVGCIVGTFLAPILLNFEFPSIELSVAGVLISCIYLPFITNTAMMYTVFFIVGTLVGIVDTGCISKLRNIQGENAGLWMSANIAAFSVSGVFAPLLQMIWDNLYFIFFIDAGVALFVLLWLVFQPKIEASNQPAKDLVEGHIVKHYYAEIAAFWGIFGFIGAAGTVIDYVESYVTDTGVIASSKKADLLFVILVFLCVTRVGIIWEQQHTNLFRIYGFILACCILAVAAMVAVLINPNSGVVLWVAMAVYGAAIGPGSGLFFDLTNRYTYNTNLSSAILMLGINLGGNFAPYIASALWDYTALGPTGLIVTLLVLLVIPVPSALVVPCVAYKEATDN